MDIALVNLPPWSQENPHIGIGYLSTYLRQKGILPKIFDLNKLFFKDHPDTHDLWHVENKNYWSNEKTFRLILEIFEKDIDRSVAEISVCDAGILGFSVVDPKERLTLEFIKRIKQKAPQKRVILGGPATSTREQRQIFLDHAEKDIDFFVTGEGEETLFQLTDRMLKRKSTDGVQGCYMRRNGEWVRQERPPLHPLEAMPFPTYEEFDMDLYSRSLLVEWSRGCRGRCAFCKNYKLFPVYRTKSPEWALKELRHHKERYKIEEFTVVDNVLNGDPEILGAICDRMKKEDLKLRWTGQIAPRKDMDFDFFKRMKGSGCFKLQIGLESASDKVLKAMRKPFTAGVSEQNIRDAKKAGIETEIFVMVGFPGESEEDFILTSDFIKRNVDFIDAIKSINSLHLIAGTDIYDHAREFGLKELPRNDWHYLWETRSGNTYPVRKERVKRLLEAAEGQKIKVIETNIAEGKELRLDLPGHAGRLEAKLRTLKGSGPEIRTQDAPGSQKRNFKKWMILFFVSVFVMIYMAYFWFFALLSGKMLLGGKRK